MKKNQKTYLLLIAVVAVWGAIGYQFYTRYNPETTIVIENKRSLFNPQQTQEVTSYTIEPDYRDPFTGKLYQKKVLPKRKVTPKPAVVFPAIEFKGIIEGNQKTYIIAINNQQEIFQLQQTKQEVTLVKATGKEVTLKYQNETKKYTLKE